MEKHKNPNLKIYQVFEEEEIFSKTQREGKFLIKFEVFLEDKPGSLADFSSLIAECKGNISFFYYDRSLHSNRVVVEVKLRGKETLEKFLQRLREKDYFSLKFKNKSEDKIQITTPESVLEIKVRLANEPGSLVAFALLLKEHQANVIYMFYDENIDPQSANIALAVKNPGEVNDLLAAINDKSYTYKVVYRGSEKEKVERIIGLKLVEKFFLRLRKLMPDKNVQELMDIVDSSERLYKELVHFYSEVGKYPEKGDIFARVLTFASTSIAKVGKNFYAKKLPSLQVNNVELFVFRLPTGGNIFVFQGNQDVGMFDAGYGLYYEDVKALFKSKKINPGHIKRIFISHSDADHAGASGYFAEEFGAEVFMHPDCRGCIENENRIYGVDTKLLKLNEHFTRLVNNFTKCKYPERVSYFSTNVIDRIGGFNLIDTFQLCGLKFGVLESHGGHVPGQVFFLNREYGLLFTSDYLINIDSLSVEEKEYMRVPRYLMTSTNANSRIFREETKSLIGLIFLLYRELKEQGRSMLIFPGHGDYYEFQGELPFPIE